MLKLVSLFSLVVVCSINLRAQSSACCVSATESFAALGSDPEFRKSHQLPKKSSLNAEGEMVKFKTPDGQTANAFFIPARVPTNKWIFIFHEWWGLNNNIKNEAQKIHNDLDYINILAIDLYDGKIAETREKAEEYMKNASDPRVRNIIKGAINHVGELADVGTLGWCFGGGWALQAAIMLGEQADGCVMYYGMPETDLKKLKKLETPVLAFFAENDPWVSEEKVDLFRQKMNEADQKLEVMTFNANHAFANPSNDNLSNIAAGKAYAVMIKFLDGNLNIAN